MSSEQKNQVPISRLYGFLLAFLLCSVALVARAVNLQVMETEFLQGQGEARFMREVEIPTRRGNIVDRAGEPLAVSTPVDSVWVNPTELLQTPEDIDPLAKALDLNADEIERRLNQRSGCMTLAEIAAATGATEEAVKSRLRYALARLREALDDG